MAKATNGQSKEKQNKHKMVVVKILPDDLERIMALRQLYLEELGISQSVTMVVTQAIIKGLAAMESSAEAIFSRQLPSGNGRQKLPES